MESGALVGDDGAEGRSLGLILGCLVVVNVPEGGGSGSEYRL